MIENMMRAMNAAMAQQQEHFLKLLEDRDANKRRHETVGENMVVGSGGTRNSNRGGSDFDGDSTWKDMLSQDLSELQTIGISRHRRSSEVHELTSGDGTSIPHVRVRR